MVGSFCPDCAQVNTKAKLRRDDPRVFVRLVGNPLITGTRYAVSCLYCDICDNRYEAFVPESIKQSPKYDVSCATTLAIGRYSLGLPMSRTEQNQSMHGLPMNDATQWDLSRGLRDLVVPAHGVLTQMASDGTLMVYDDTPGCILANQAQGVATHTTAQCTV